MAWNLDQETLKRRAAEARRKIPPAERSLIATKAAYGRWYSAKGSDIDRIESYLRRLAKIAAKAFFEKNDDRAIRAIAAMATFERMRIWLNNTAGKPTGAALDLQQLEDHQTKLAEAKKRREQILSGDQTETVIEESDGASETK